MNKLYFISKVFNQLKQLNEVFFENLSLDEMDDVLNLYDFEQILKARIKVQNDQFNK